VSVGITDHSLAAVVKAGLEATKVNHLLVGGQVQVVESPDWGVRHKFADMALRLMNVYPAQQVDITATTYEERLRMIAGRLRAEETPARVTVDHGVDPRDDLCVAVLPNR